MLLPFLLFAGGFFVLDAAHAPLLALACLACALFMVHPIRVLVILALASVMRLLVAGVEAVFRIGPARTRGIERTPPIYVPPPGKGKPRWP